MAELNQSTQKSGNKHSNRRTVPHVDLTAMVDLAFLLITFFMLTTSLAKPRNMPVVMPSDGPAGSVGESSTMTICLGKSNQVMYYLGMAEKPLTAPQLTGYGKGLHDAIIETGKQVYKSTGKKMMVIIKPDDHSVYNNLVEALDEMNIINVPTYAIAKITPKDIDLLKQKGIY